MTNFSRRLLCVGALLAGLPLAGAAAEPGVTDKAGVPVAYYFTDFLMCSASEDPGVSFLLVFVQVHHKEIR